MFSVKKKLEHNLHRSLENNEYKRYRVLIQCKNLKENIIKKLSSSKNNKINNQLIYSLDYSNLICAYLTSSTIYRLIEYPEVTYICFDEYLFLSGISVTSVNTVPKSLTSKLTGLGISIGLVDSGVYPHTDLFTKPPAITEFNDIINNYRYPYDDNGHGTAICGIISGSGLSSKGLYRGIAPNSKIVCYKAFDKLGKGLVSDILYSIEELIKHNTIKILCLPFELLTHNYFINSLFETVFNIAITKNIIPILPAGSNLASKNTIMGISTLKNCITIGGIDTSSEPCHYNYSSYGVITKNQKPDFCAACVNITSLNSNTSFIPEKKGAKLYPSPLKANYKSFSGTSMSCAFVSGICALLLENNPDLSFNDIFSILKLSCSTNALPKDKVGDGIIDFSKLLT
ncbi:S8 family serine peptidase [Clostridium sp. MSJ-8]|uniref:S8 family serine peptidase n=1 Tax=Clostridium sp. MSJ-8 TaxID=2841510 RepID=UPI001C0F2F4E|nr:S8 family serine peptidase [Clostridium sp. MSJ-8]MBU5488083.1 S8 family serine peptidase [Clostridium sp. MSJ-8]